MIVEPRVRGFMCVTSHPTGCARNVQDQKKFAELKSEIVGPKRVLIIGEAKRDLDLKALIIRKRLQAIGGDARVSVLKAVVTQASAAIPIMPLYLSILFREMKRKGTHEGCIEQIYRLFKECLYTDSPRIDETGRLRVDDLELQPQIQNAVSQSWTKAEDENLSDVADLPGYKDEFLKLFGFHVEGVDYNKSVEIQVSIEKLIQT